MLKKNQTKLFIALVCGIILIYVISIKFTEKERTNLKLNPSSSRQDRIQLLTITKGAKAEDRWIQRSEEELNNLKEELFKQKEDQKRIRLELEKRVEELEKLKNKEKGKDSDEADRRNRNGVERIGQERGEERGKESGFLGGIEPHAYSKRDSKSNFHFDPNFNHHSNPALNASFKTNKTNFTTNSNTDLNLGQSGEISLSRQIGFIELSSSSVNKKRSLERERKLNSFSTYNYLPSGSYVPAVVMSGIDASVGIKSQTNPRPVLFRITDEAKNAWFKGDKEHQKIDLTGCVVTGAAEGDLSSERVFVNLVRMSCSREDEQVIETEVKGYVVSQGKAGIRGKVISREGDFITKSFLAGIIGGFGGGASQYFTTPASATMGGFTTTQRPEAGDILGQGLGKGVGKASDRLSKYLIDRAEQYQPVVSISSGLEVELVFHKGVYIDGRKK